VFCCVRLLSRTFESWQLLTLQEALVAQMRRTQGMQRARRALCGWLDASQEASYVRAGLESEAKLFHGHVLASKVLLAWRGPLRSKVKVEAPPPALHAPSSVSQGRLERLAALKHISLRYGVGLQPSATTSAPIGDSAAQIAPLAPLRCDAVSACCDADPAVALADSQSSSPVHPMFRGLHLMADEPWERAAGSADTCALAELCGEQRLQHAALEAWVCYGARARRKHQMARAAACYRTMSLLGRAWDSWCSGGSDPDEVRQRAMRSLAPSTAPF